MGLGRAIDLPDGDRDSQVLALLQIVIEQHREIVEKNRQYPSISHGWLNRLSALESFLKLAESRTQ